MQLLQMSTRSTGQRTRSYGYRIQLSRSQILRMRGDRDRGEQEVEDLRQVEEMEEGVEEEVEEVVGWGCGVSGEGEVDYLYIYHRDH